MKMLRFARLFLCFAFGVAFSSAAFSQTGFTGIFGGGPLYINATNNINEIKNSGFTEVIVWNIEVKPNGDLNFNGEFPLVANGVYIGGQAHPDFAGNMGETAENVARKHKISRADQDQFALQSQQRWSAAHQSGLFAEEIVPVEIPQRKGAPTLVSVDEHPRPDTTLENLAKLKPAFSKDDQGTVTAGNSSGINDGAAALLIVEAGLAKSLGLQPIAFIGPSAAAGVDPAFMLLEKSMRVTPSRSVTRQPLPYST